MNTLVSFLKVFLEVAPEAYDLIVKVVETWAGRSGADAEHILKAVKADRHAEVDAEVDAALDAAYESSTLNKE